MTKQQGCLNGENRVGQGVKISNHLCDPSAHHEFIQTHGKHQFPLQYRGQETIEVKIIDINLISVNSGG